MKRVSVKAKNNAEFMRAVVAACPYVNYVHMDGNGFVANCIADETKKPTKNEVRIHAADPAQVPALALFHTQGSDVGFKGDLMLPEEADFGLPVPNAEPAAEAVPEAAPSGEQVKEPAKDETPPGTPAITL